MIAIAPWCMAMGLPDLRGKALRRVREAIPFVPAIREHPPDRLRFHDLAWLAQEIPFKFANVPLL